MQTPNRKGFLNAFHLKLLAMAFMLCSHMRSTVIAGSDWLYNGKQGPHNKVIQYSCYAFYPLNMAVLAELMRAL